MDQTQSVADALSGADSLGGAVVALARAFPNLTVSGLFAAERVEVFELGWVPSAAHPDCTHLVTLAALLQPVWERHGDLPFVHALRHLVDAGHAAGAEIEAALAHGLAEHS